MAYGSILAVCAGVGLLAGVLLHRSDYCLAGAFRDIFLFRSTFMIRNLFLCVTVSMVLFEGARRLGAVPAYPFPLFGPPSVAGAVGGAVFGIGMVLSGGCVVGTLVRLGAGSFLSGAALIGLLAGSAFYAEIHPSWVVVVRALRLPGEGTTLPQILNVDPAVPVAVVVLPALGLFSIWRRKGKWTCAARPEGYLQPWAASLGLALLGLASVLAVGMPIGITTTYAKMAALLEAVVVPAHVRDLAFFNTVPLRAFQPVTGALLVGGPGPVLDAVAAIQAPVIVGILLGSMFSALSLGEFRWSRKVPRPQAAAAFAGGLLMGLGSRMGAGCNVWHILGGLPIFSISSLLFVSGLLPGAWVGGVAIRRLLA